MRIAYASLLASLSLALPAQAEKAAVRAPTPAMSAPSLSESDAAKPDWYQQFTFSTRETDTPAWQGGQAKNLNLAWVKGNRWSVRVEMTKREAISPLPKDEMSAGANFLITPRISVGGEVSIASETTSPSTLNWTSAQVEAGIRLRSAFKF